MAAALAAEKPLSMTFLSACGSDNMATAATSSASIAMIMRPRYGMRNGTSARNGLSDLLRGLSEEDRSAVGLSLEARVLTEPESAQVQVPPHAEIRGEAVERKAERGGLVALETEMPEPR